MTEIRSRDRLQAHYEVERELAQRVLNATREERKTLYPTLYDELFERIPDHPRLTRQATEEDRRRGVQVRMRLLEGILSKEHTFVEIAPGDCTLSLAVSDRVDKVIAADISPQATTMPDLPENFTFLQYDGYDLPIEDASVDVLFSYQFLEHIHPDDVDLHMSVAHRVLKDGGIYVFDTPHKFSGPHDVSRHFETTAKGFHLKEWTYGEMITVLRRHGFSDFALFRRGGTRKGLERSITLFCERLAGALPAGLRRALVGRFFCSVGMIAGK